MFPAAARPLSEGGDSNLQAAHILNPGTGNRLRTKTVHASVLARFIWDHGCCAPGVEIADPRSLCTGFGFFHRLNFGIRPKGRSLE